MRIIIQSTLIFLILILTGFSNNVIAQNYSYNWVNYTTKQGLPSNHVFYCYQDKKGFMWFGTNQGVSKFDGIKFVNYNERNGLSDIEISKIQEDDFGNLWVCSLWGNIYHFHNDSFIPYKYNHLIQAYRENFRVVCGFDIKTNKNDSVINFYIGLDFYGVLKINSNGQESSFRSKYISSIILYTSENNSFAIEQLDFKNPNWRQNQLYKPCHIFEMCDDSLQFLDYRYLGKGINRFYQKYNYNYLVGTFGSLSILENNKQILIKNVQNCNDLIVNNDGKILIGGLDNRGLQMFSNLQQLKYGKSITLLGNVSVSKILVDNHKGYWLTTTNDGVYYLRSLGLKKLVNINTHLDINNFEKIKVTESGSALWISNSNQDLVYYNLVSNKFKVFSLTKQNIHDILSIPNSISVYIAGSRKTILIEQNKPCYVIEQRDTSFLTSKKMIYSKLTNTIFGFDHWGIFELNRNKLIYRENYSFDNRTTGRAIRSIYQDQYDSLWIIRMNGIYQFDVKSKYLIKKSIENLEDKIVDLYRLSKNCFLYITLTDGIIFKDKDTTFKVNEKYGLQSNNIIKVKSNNVDKLYILSSVGLDRIDYEINNHIKINSINRLSEFDELDIKDFDIDSNGIWLATTNGVYYRGNEDNDSYSPIPFLEEIILDKEESIIKEFSNRNPLLIHWNCINYSLNGKISYRYRMDSTEEWFYSRNNQLALNNFKPKNYRLEVQAQNANGSWSNSLVVPFEIKKPWYRSYYFYIFGTIVLAVLILQVFINENKKLRKEALLNLELVEMERKLLSVQMNPHFLFNCLTSIQLLIRKSDLEGASIYLTKFAAITRSVLNFVKNTTITIDDEIQFLNQYLMLEKLRFKENLNYLIKVDPNISTFEISIPSLLVQPFVENSIKYGLKSNDHILNITIDFKLVHKDNILISISDNGPGINSENISNAATQPNKRESIGINLSRLRINKHNNRKIINGLIIQPILNLESNVIGTKVEILLAIT